jgi:hypothetical protein
VCVTLSQNQVCKCFSFHLGSSSLSIVSCMRGLFVVQMTTRALVGVVRFSRGREVSEEASMFV